MSNVAIDNFIRTAEGDIRAAERLLECDPPLLENAAYHAQQAAEKAVKGVLQKHGIRFDIRREGHDVSALAAKIPPTSPFATEAARLGGSTPWATAYRYFSEKVPPTVPTPQEIAEILKDAKTISEGLKRGLPPPSSALAAGLLATTPAKRLPDRLVALRVTRKDLEEALSGTPGGAADHVRALRAIAEAIHQPEYRTKDGRLVETGRIIHGWSGLAELHDRMKKFDKASPWSRLYFNVVRLDDHIQARSQLEQEFAALLKVHNSREPPHNTPSPQVDGGRPGR